MAASDAGCHSTVGASLDFLINALLGFTFRAAQMSEHTKGELSREEVAEVYRRHGYLLEERCRRILRDDALAEDAMQQTSRSSHAPGTS